MSERLLNAFMMVGGAAILLNGFWGRDLSNDVEMPMTREELANKKSPTKIARTIYMIFGFSLFVYGLAHLKR